MSCWNRQRASKILMFAKTADKITQKLKENHTINDEHYEICRYGLQQGFSIILNVVSTIVINVALGMLWQAGLFTALYIPLRSHAGVYHANTAIRCYVYSVLLMIAVLLAINHISIPSFICIIALLISFKPLDEMEQVVYKKVTLIINNNLKTIA